MEFLCPHCQNKLMVQDEYAGTLMKCPYCSKTFQAPAQAPALPPVPPPAPASSPPPAPAGYGLAAEPPAPPKSAPPPPPSVTPVSREAPSGPVSPPPTSTEYQRTHTATLSPKVLPWVAVGAWFLVFVLFFFSWVGLYPGGYGAYWQGPLGIAVGGGDPDKDWVLYVKEASKEGNTVSRFMLVEKSDGKLEMVPPGGGVFMGLFIFFFFWLALLTAAVSVAWPLLQIKLPPVVEQLRPWRWAIAAGLSLLAFFFLAMQLLVGLGLEHKVVEQADKVVKDKFADQQQSFKDWATAERVAAVNPQRTFALRLAFWLSLLATVAAGLQFWLDYRGSRPLPQLALRW
jgi:hypothetical protein